ncbi:MAG: hypothetical protein R2856_30870 [Caldilineaceae bacterium]
MDEHRRACQHRSAPAAGWRLCPILPPKRRGTGRPSTWTRRRAAAMVAAAFNAEALVILSNVPGLLRNY